MDTLTILGTIFFMGWIVGVLMGWFFGTLSGLGAWAMCEGIKTELVKKGKIKKK